MGSLSRIIDAACFDVAVGERVMSAAVLCLLPQHVEKLTEDFVLTTSFADMVCACTSAGYSCKGRGLCVQCRFGHGEFHPRYHKRQASVLVDRLEAASQSDHLHQAM